MDLRGHRTHPNSGVPYGRSRVPSTSRDHNRYVTPAGFGQGVVPIANWREGAATHM